MTKHTVRFTCFPRTEPPPDFVREVVAAFIGAESSISTGTLSKGLTSNEVLTVLRPALKTLGFKMESGKTLAV